MREESKNHRLQKKAYETKLKDLLGLKPEDDINNVEELISNYKTNNSKAVEEAFKKSNERLIKAEIKALEAQGYNTKLVEKLINTSSLKIDDDGNITGLTEAVQALEQDFPEIKKSQQPSGGINPAGQNMYKDVSLKCLWKSTHSILGKIKENKF